MGSATTVKNRVIKLQSVGVTVRHHTPTEDQYTNRLIQGSKSPKKINRRLNFKICKVLLIFCRVFWPGSLNLEKVYIISRQLAKGNWMGIKAGKIS